MDLNWSRTQSGHLLVNMSFPSVLLIGGTLRMTTLLSSDSLNTFKNKLVIIRKTGIDFFTDSSGLLASISRRSSSNDQRCTSVSLSMNNISGTKHLINLKFSRDILGYQVQSRDRISSISGVSSDLCKTSPSSKRQFLVGSFSQPKKIA